MDISLSGAEVALIAALLGAVTAPLTMMFRMLIAEKQARIDWLEAQNAELLKITTENTQAVRSAATTLSKDRGAR